MLIFSIYDSKAEAYLTPFFSKNVATAIRSFAAAANDQAHDFNRFAADYTLFCIGTWDETTGELHFDQVKKNLGTALDHIKPAELQQLGLVKE